MPAASAAAAAVRPRKRPRWGGQHHPATSPSSPLLPLDLQLDIAARTDPPTLVRCAATCRDLRRRVADPGFRRRHRLRHGDRFVRSLLGGHLTRKWDEEEGREKYAVVSAAWSSSSSPAGPKEKPFTFHGRPVSARDGLLLVHVTGHQLLAVYCSDTGRSQALPFPPGSPFDGQFVLLVGNGGGGGGGGVGRPFRILNADLVSRDHHLCCLWIQTFSSEHGAWSPCTSIPIPAVQGSSSRLLGKPLVFHDAVHWLCSTNSSCYILTLQLASAAAPRVTSAKLPASFPCAEPDQLLLATPSVGRSPIVLVADGVKVSAWARSERTGRWRTRPRVVIRNDAIVRRLSKVGGVREGAVVGEVRLEWFGERSGVVLVRMPYRDGFCWLDLRSMEIIECCIDSWTTSGSVCCPYEMDLSAWVPKFHKTF